MPRGLRLAAIKRAIHAFSALVWLRVCGLVPTASEPSEISHVTQSRSVFFWRIGESLWKLLSAPHCAATHAIH